MTENPSFWKRNQWLIVASTGFAIIGIAYISVYFPGFNWFQTLFGGIAFGLLCVLFVAGGRLLE